MTLWEERERRRVGLVMMFDEANAELGRGQAVAFVDESKPSVRRRRADATPALEPPRQDEVQICCATPATSILLDR